MKTKIEKLLEKVGEKLREQEFDPPDYLINKAVQKFEAQTKGDSSLFKKLEETTSIIGHIISKQRLAVREGNFENLGRLFYKIPDGEIAIEFLKDNLVGEILFDDNRPKEGLLVSLIDEDSNGVIKETQTDDDGFFEFLEVPMGSYLLRIKLAEDQEIIIEHIKKGGDTDGDEF